MNLDHKIQVKYIQFTINHGMHAVLKFGYCDPNTRDVAENARDVAKNARDVAKKARDVAKIVKTGAAAWTSVF